MTRSITVRIGVVLLVGCLIVTIVGYAASDGIYYKQFLREKHLNTPERVFKYTTAYYGIASPGDTIQPYLSPRYLMKRRKKLWCDEGATVMATLDHTLGYKTRLIDLYGADNISHHTVMQVFENSRWITYDFTYRLRDVPFNQCTQLYKYNVAKVSVKPYPKFYNAVVNNNAVAKFVLFKLRSIQEK